MNSTAHPVSALSNIIHLTISRDYVSQWGVWEAAREFIQNAFDTKQYHIGYQDDSLTIETHAGALDKRNLLLGVSSKRNDSEAIGTYGEGFKLAMLVMLREGKSITIKNGKDKWTPHFTVHPELNHECLALTIEENVFVENPDTVAFKISGLTEDEIRIIQDKSLYGFDSSYIEAQYGKSFCWFNTDSQRQKLFVGSLYVCDLSEKFKLSYNFSPDILSLDRDRHSVSDFSLSLEATKMLALSGNYDLLAQLADEQAEDVSDYYRIESTRYHVSDSDDETCVETISDTIKGVVSETFLKSHGENAYPINASLSEKEKRVQTVKAVDAGLVPVVVKQGYFNMLNDDVKSKKVSDFKSFNLSDEVFKFYEENKSQLRGKPLRAMKQLIEKLELHEGKRDIPQAVKEKVVVAGKPLSVPVAVGPAPAPVPVTEFFDDDIPF